jgi:hypothetical protein
MWTAHERLRWQIILALMAFDAVVALSSGIAIHGANLIFAAGFLAFLAFGVFYRFVRPIEHVASAVIALSQIAAFAVTLALTSYLALTFNRPLIDGLLYSMDQSLGFDWATAFKFLMSTPLLKHILGLAYNSTQAQIVLLAAALGLAGQTERLEKFMLAFMVGGVMTICLWALYPSYGAATYVYTLGAAGGLPGLNAVFRFVEPQLALQSGHLTSITLTELTGVVGAPSFHTVMSLVTVYACASLGKWFWPVAAWNVLVVASVPVFGGHHVCDVLAGAAVAVAAIYIAEWMAARLGATADQSPTAPAGKIVAAE